MRPVQLRIDSARKRLDSTFSRIAAIPIEDAELRSDGARYLCVLVSGFLETSVVSLIISYVSEVSHPRVSNFAERNIKNTTNLKSEKLSQIIGSLDVNWENEFRNYIKDGSKAAIDSVVDLRHQIAHGGHTSVSYNSVRDYYVEVCKVVDYLIDLLVTQQSASAA